MSIDTARRALLFAVLLIGAGLSLPSNAQGYGHGGGGHHGGGGYYGGGWHGGWYGGGVGWWGVGLGWRGAYLGAPYGYYPYGGYYAYPGYYYPYAASTWVVEPSQVPALAQGVESPPTPPAASNWYYCDSAKAYYPYVNHCPEPWRAVPAVPPGPVR